MKKFTVITLAMMLVGGAAFASSLAVPFFNDNNTAFRSFIGVINMTDQDIDAQVWYTQTNATTLAVVDLTPADNTFTIPAGAAVAWEPVQNNPAAEGAGATLVPDMLANTQGTGSAILTWNTVNSSNDLLGRMVQVSMTGGGQHAYLLPPGVTSIQ